MNKEPRDGVTTAEEELDSIPVRVALELGRLEMVVGEVRELAPGMLLPLTRSKEEAVDIVVNGRRIGKGTLVAIGDSIGVRVTRLQNDG